MSLAHSHCLPLLSAPPRAVALSAACSPHIVGLCSPWHCVLLLPPNALIACRAVHCPLLPPPTTIVTDCYGPCTSLSTTGAPSCHCPSTAFYNQGCCLARRRRACPRRRLDLLLPHPSSIVSCAFLRLIDAATSGLSSRHHCGHRPLLQRQWHCHN